MSDNAPRPAPQRVAVIGAGGISGIVAAALEAAGHEVTLCVRTSFPKLTVEWNGSRDVPVAIATRPDGLAPGPWLFVGTKAQDTAEAAPWLGALAGRATKVVVLQNGIDHEARVKPFVNGAVILPAIVQMGGERIAPGHILHQGGNRLVVPRGEDGAALTGLLAGSGIDVRQTEDFLTATWRKLLGNVMANPITALTYRRQEVLADPLIRELARDLLRETIKVAQAAGARIADEEADRMTSPVAGDRSTAGTSMLYDRLAGRPLEHDYLTGAVIRAAEQHGIDVPLNRAIYALVNALSKAGRPSR